MALNNTNLVARYHLDEGASTTITDVSGVGSAENLTLDLGSGNASWNTATANHTGINFAASDGAGGIVGTLTGKLNTAFNDVKLFTVEFVADIQGSGPGDSGYLFSISDGAGASGPFSVQIYDDDGTVYIGHEFPGGDFQGAEFTHDSVGAGREVWHVVVDTDEGTASNRIKLYIDGSEITTKTGTFPGSAELLGGDSGDDFGFGCQATDVDTTMDGLIHYLAIYDGVMSPTNITANAGELATATDEASNTIPNTPTATATPSGSTVVLGTGAFSDPDGGDTHKSSNWRVYRVV